MNCSLWNFCLQVRAVLKMDFNDSDIHSPLLSRSRGHTVPILFSLHLISVTVELVEKLKSNSSDFSATLYVQAVILLASLFFYSKHGTYFREHTKCIYLQRRIALLRQVYTMHICHKSCFQLSLYPCHQYFISGCGNIQVFMQKFIFHITIILLLFMC